MSAKSEHLVDTLEEGLCGGSLKGVFLSCCAMLLLLVPAGVGISFIWGDKVAGVFVAVGAALLAVGGQLVVFLRARPQAKPDRLKEIQKLAEATGFSMDLNESVPSVKPPLKRDEYRTGEKVWTQRLLSELGTFVFHLITVLTLVACLLVVGFGISQLESLFPEEENLLRYGGKIYICCALAITSLYCLSVCCLMIFRTTKLLRNDPPIERANASAGGSEEAKPSPLAGSPPVQD